MSRILILDSVKAAAIILIVFIHLYNYLLHPPVAGCHDLIALLSFLALAGFTFVSGYTIHASNSGVRTREDVIGFYKKRVLRVYPLYLIALATFFVCFQMLRLFPPLELSPAGWAINALCLQVLLAPAFTDPVFTLWFVGFIMVLYLLYPVIMAPARSARGIILISGGIFALLAVLHFLLNIVDVRLLQYYFFFIAGIVASRSNIGFSRFEARFQGRGAGITAASYASYCVYLFHMPVFAVSAAFMGRLSPAWYLHDAAMYMVVPALFGLSYYVQKAYDANIRSLRSGKAAPG